MKEKQAVQNSENAQMLALDLQQKEQIDSKINYYKTMLKAYQDLAEVINKKVLFIDSIELSQKSLDDVYEKNKLILEKLEIENTIFNKKQFFEMWLKRSADYEQKFAIINAECNEKFDEVEAQAKEIALGNIRLKSYMDKYDKEEHLEDKNKDRGFDDFLSYRQRIKVEYYLLLKYEITKLTGKGKFEVVK